MSMSRCDCDCFDCEAGDHCHDVESGCRYIAQEDWDDEMLAATDFFDHATDDPEDEDED